MTGTGMASRSTNITWGTTGQFPQTIENPLSQSITLGFDSNSGVKTSQTDPNYTSTNPLMTTWQYDPFFRKVLESRPDGTSTTYAYNNCATNGCVNANNQTTVTVTALNYGGSTEAVDNQYLDSLDRTLVTSKTMLSGTYDRNEVQYDNLGRIANQAFPCLFSGCTQSWSSNSYDILNRVIESERPVNAASKLTSCNPATVPPIAGCQGTSYGYLGRTTTVTDALANTTTKISLATGAMARSQDPNGYYQNFTYDSFGSLLSVTDSASPANTLFTAQYSYGIQAFQTESTDMDLGARSYTIDPLGEVTAYADAKNQNFTVTYDALSRPLIRTESDLTTTWTWGNTAASYNIGKLASVTGASSPGTYSEAYTYDSLTRLSTKVITIPGDSSYTFTYAYNTTTGLLNTLLYPVSISPYYLKLQYAYSYGILSSITDAAIGTVYWAANTVNPRGQVTQETLGNGVITTRSFDAVTGWVSNIEAGLSGGSGILNSAYTFDLVGDVTQRQNNNLGLTENFYYDADYRLNHSTLNGTVNLQMAYDTAGMGNIASRSDVAGGTAWTYDPVRKHAVTQAGTGGYSFTYDANGNATTRNGYNVTWTSYNYLTGISSSGESATFQYGPNRQRWQMVYTGSSGTETTYYIGGLIEKVITPSGPTLTTYRNYIYAGGEAVATNDRNSSGYNSVHYFLEDHQGSVASILTYAGAAQVNESFTAYGNRRSGETWSGAPTSSDESTINGVTREGYTWQTALGVSMGLNHMNGRVQDAITGRFLSPDPLIPDPGNTQSYNRYSYVLNNPLTYTDPTGFKTNCGIGCAVHGGWKGWSGFSGFYDDFFDDSGPSDNWANISAMIVAYAGAAAAAFPNFLDSSFVNGSSNSGAQSGGCVGSPCAVNTSAGVGVGVLGGLGEAAGEGLGWLAAALGSAVSVIGGALVPNTNMATLDQDSPGFTFYHGTDLNSGLSLLNGAPLSAGAADANSNFSGITPGFYLATTIADATDFATDKGAGGVVLQYNINASTMQALSGAGATFSPITPGANGFPAYQGPQFVIPVSAFPVFNTGLASGGIVVVPAPH